MAERQTYRLVIQTVSKSNDDAILGKRLPSQEIWLSGKLHAGNSYPSFRRNCKVPGTWAGRAFAGEGF